MDNNLKEMAQIAKEEFDKKSNDLLNETLAIDNEIGIPDDEDETEFVISANNDNHNSTQEKPNEIPPNSNVPILNVNVNLDERKSYVKELITKYGMSINEAEEAASKKFDNITTDKPEDNETESLSRNDEKTVIVKVPESASEKIEFSDEEREKLRVANSIKLIEIKNENLETIKFTKYKRKDKINIIKDLDKSISRYSSPMPALGEFFTFKGAQTITLLTNVIDENDSMSEALNKKAALLYDKFIGGTTISKTDEDGNIVMSFNEFANMYRYNDVDMGLYTIFVASSREEIETVLGCTFCKKDFKHKYNIKSLLKGDTFPDKYKEKMDNIISHHSNTDYIKELVSESTKTKRLKSTFTENVIDISSPSLSKAMKIFQYIDEKDQVMVYNANLILYIDMIAVKKGDEYIPFGYDEEIEKELEENPSSSSKYQDYNPIAELFEIIQELPQYELDLIAKAVSEFQFDTEFELKSKCSNCGRTLTNSLSITNMVFLTAQGSTVQTE